MVELCRCNHANDHRGKPCGHDLADGSKCQCPVGIRVDIFMSAQLDRLFKVATAQLNTSQVLLQITAEANGYEITEEGELRKKSVLVV